MQNGMKPINVNVDQMQVFVNNKQQWNNYKCRCEWKELFDNGRYDKGFIWNPDNCECECDKSCDLGEYLDYKKYNTEED